MTAYRTIFPPSHAAVSFHLTQPHPQARKRKPGRSLTFIPWTTTDDWRRHIQMQCSSRSLCEKSDRSCNHECVKNDRTKPCIEPAKHRWVVFVFMSWIAYSFGLSWVCGVVSWWFLREIEVRRRWARLVHGWMTLTEVRRTVGRLECSPKSLSC